MNVLVVYSADTGATKVAQHYADGTIAPAGPPLRPPRHHADADDQSTCATYQTLIQAPLDACFAALPHPDEIDYLVLVRGLPYSVTLPAYAASLEALLQVRHTTKIATSMELAGAGAARHDGQRLGAEPRSIRRAFGTPRTTRS